MIKMVNLLWALPADCPAGSRSDQDIFTKAMDPSASLFWFKLSNPKLRKADLLQRPLQLPVLKERLGV